MIAVMYHYIGQPVHGLKVHSLDLSTFQRQLDFFLTNYDVINASTLANKRAIVEDETGLLLTFDDGLKEHYDVVVPELDKRGISAFFFVSTSIFSQAKLLNVHRLHALIATVPTKELLREIELFIEPEMIDNDSFSMFGEDIYKLQTTNNSSETKIKLLLNYQLHYQYIDIVLDRLTNKYLDENMLFNKWYMTSDNINEISSHHVVGAHSHFHRVLSRLSPPDQEDEISKSYHIISKLTGQPCRWFCYPYGGLNTFNDTTTDLLNEFGFDYAFAVAERPINNEDIKERYRIPRYDCISFKV